jgi:hypothetical protein
MFRGKSSRCISTLLALTGGLMSCLFLGIDAPNVLGQQKPKELVWTHAFDLACRRLGELDFTKETQKFGVEAFKDTNNGLGLFLSQVGSLAIGRGFQELKLPLTSKGPEWITGLDLPARKAGEEKFENAKVHSMEVFRDPNTDNWIYITEKGHLAVTSAKVANKTGADKKPRWTHSVDLRVRKGGVKDWKDAAKVGIEVYRDNTTGNVIYISETGAIAVLPETSETKGGTEGKAPAWLHGLDLACRKNNEPNFTKDTRKFGVEVFLDANNGNLIFLCENGNLAVTPGPKNIKAPTTAVNEPIWTHGLNLKVRRAGEKEFSERTAVFGAEVFRDENLGVTLYIAENGSIAALAK